MGFDLSQLKNSEAIHNIIDYLRRIDGNRNQEYASKNQYFGETDTFFTTTSVNRSAYDRPFIIGFIPPDISVNFLPIKQDVGQLVKGKRVVVTGSSSTGAVGVSGNLTDNVKERTPADWEAFVRMCDGLQVDPEAMLPPLFLESAFSPQSQCPIYKNGKLVGFAAKGLNQISYQVYKKPLKDGSTLMNESTWNSYGGLSFQEQLPYVAKYFKNAGLPKGASSTAIYAVNIGGGGMSHANEPNFVIYAEKPNPGWDKWKDEKGAPAKYYEANSGLDYEPKDGQITIGDIDKKMADIKRTAAFRIATEAIAAARQRIANGTDADTLKSVMTTTGPAKGESAQQIGIMIGASNITGPEALDPLGRYISVDEGRSQAANKAVQETQRQITELAQTPALMLLINPRSFTRNYEQTVDYAGGWRGQIVSMWLEKPIKISGSGTTAAQYAMIGSGEGGLTNVNRVFSLSYENLMSLMMIYRNNGWLYSGDAYGPSNTGVPVLGLSLYIYYDGHLYLGSFDSFGITDSAEKPYNMDYSFDFTARYDIPIDYLAGEGGLQGGSVGVTKSG